MLLSALQREATDAYRGSYEQVHHTYHWQEALIKALFVDWSAIAEGQQLDHAKHAEGKQNVQAQLYNSVDPTEIPELACIMTDGESCSVFLKTYWDLVSSGRERERVQ